ncbi:NAD(P)/FAD-dependent oxidoreductase [Chloroflexota bacterium]
MMETRYLIIGNSAGGIGAVEAIRDHDSAGTITIVSGEPYPVYGRALIAKYLTGERTFEDIMYRSEDFYEQNNINVLLGTNVEGINTNTRTATLDDGQTVSWDKLLLATGGTPIVSQMNGLDKKGVFTFTRLDDAKTLDKYLYNAGKAVVIGGGLIGISVSEALYKRGIDVTIVEMKDRILNVILDEQASQMAQETLSKVEVRIITNNTVAEIGGDESVREVILCDGQVVPCDLVVVAIGVVPRIDLAAAAGIEVNRGILVDRQMQTNASDVYACGDVAEAYDFVYDACRPVPIWPGAYIGGRTAGINMAGGEAEYPGVTVMNSLNYFGLDIVSAGIVVAPDDSYEVLISRSNGNYKRIVLKDNLIKGMEFVRDIDKSGIIFSLMKDAVDVGEFKEKLMTDDFGLIHLPEAMWRQRLECRA